ncbi:MAG: bifunctional folylpolyglutamate synthase/dihydrofolate synthase [Bacteroidales bacterium]|nr:bifunctional folylpolyglutamate synthase/dihydrofolate synthase [Bacteroidales bacterium]
MYKELLDEIFKCYPMYHKIGSAAYKEGLENIEALLAIVGNPERRLKAVHIAGTNGKGSVAHLMASYCQERHLRTGLFTSPHLVDFRERIRINGEMIPEEAVLDFFRQYKSQFDTLEPSFFEMTTALAFHYFAHQQVDVAVVEVGLGGRLDCTNVLHPMLSIITNITLEHTQMLGDTIAKIAFEKAGIIKQDTPVVVGEFHPESYPVFTDIADQRRAPLFLAEANYTVEGDLSDCTVHNLDGSVLYEHLHLPLDGAYQRKNLVTFLQAVELFQQLWPADKDVVPAAVEHVMSNTGLQGRWQVLRRTPLTICDVGHNVGGLSITMPQLNALPCRQLRIVFGMVSDKDLEHVIPLLPNKALYYVCRSDNDRAIPAAELADILAQHGLDCRVFGTVAQAYTAARGDAAPDDVVFIGGSCFVVGDLLAAIERKEC